MLKRWLTDKVGTLPKPTVKLPVPLSASTTIKTETTKTETTKPDTASPTDTSEATPQSEARPAELPVADRSLKTTVSGSGGRHARRNAHPVHRSRQLSWCPSGQDDR